MSCAIVRLVNKVNPDSTVKTVKEDESHRKPLLNVYTYTVSLVLEALTLINASTVKEVIAFVFPYALSVIAVLVKLH